MSAQLKITPALLHFVVDFRSAATRHHTFSLPQSFFYRGPPKLVGQKYPQNERFRGEGSRQLPLMFAAKGLGKKWKQESCLSVCLSACLPACLSVCLFVCLSARVVETEICTFDAQLQ